VRELMVVRISNKVNLAVEKYTHKLRWKRGYSVLLLEMVNINEVNPHLLGESENARQFSMKINQVNQELTSWRGGAEGGTCWRIAWRSRAEGRRLRAVSR